MLKKMLAGPIAAAAVLLGTGTLVEAREAQTTPVDAVTNETDDDDGGDKVGLLGLLGLAGLAGLGGLRRRDPVVSRYEDEPTRLQ